MFSTVGISFWRFYINCSAFAACWWDKVRWASPVSGTPLTRPPGEKHPSSILNALFINIESSIVAPASITTPLPSTPQNWSENPVKTRNKHHRCPVSIPSKQREFLQAAIKPPPAGWVETKSIANVNMQYSFGTKTQIPEIQPFMWNSKPRNMFANTSSLFLQKVFFLTCIHSEQDCLLTQGFCPTKRELARSSLGIEIDVK